MKTKIIIRADWKTIKTYPYLFTMSEGDSVEFEGKQYDVVCNYLDIDANEMIICIK